MRVAYPLTVFFDGACGVCSSEIRHYRSIADQRLRFIDIAAADFDPGKFGKTLEDFQKQLHASDAAGQFFIGVEAFRKLWEALPSPFYPLLSSVVGLPLINQAARFGYALFARNRHFLPTRHAASCPIKKQDGSPR
jgi:predicted DCC family thiol-disulfide oxidoreductase YuxK